MGVGSVEAALLPPPLLPRIGASAVRARLEKRAMKRSRALAIRFTELRSSGAARKPIPPREPSRKRRPSDGFCLVSGPPDRRAVPGRGRRAVLSARPPRPHQVLHARTRGTIWAGDLPWIRVVKLGWVWRHALMLYGWRGRAAVAAWPAGVQCSASCLCRAGHVARQGQGGRAQGRACARRRRARAWTALNPMHVHPRSADSQSRPVSAHALPAL